MVETVFLSLGSNQGDRAANLDRALELLTGGEVFLLCRSSYYLTDPVGPVRQPRFLNIACRVKSALAPEPLLDACLGVEQEMGRVRRVDKGPRLIDIDILFYDGLLLETPRLSVPHPELYARNFVLAPLKEIAPDFADPRTGKTAAQLFRECPDRTLALRLRDDWARRLPRA
jgi:2-amino-4-hydroxy-6-hydroxymethyldihydropteridine diphosphokinase